jgi:hypothetical protein
VKVGFLHLVTPPFSELNSKPSLCQAQECTHVTPAVGRLRQEDGEFKASLGYIGGPHLNKKQNKTKQKALLPGCHEVSSFLHNTFLPP